jgi:hypothetical protein
MVWGYGADAQSAGLALDTGGNVVVAARQVTKLSGADGLPLWSRALGREVPEQVLVDPAGDIAVATRVVAGQKIRGRVWRLSGRNGRPRTHTAAFPNTVLLGAAATSDVFFAHTRLNDRTLVRQTTLVDLHRPRSGNWQRPMLRNADPGPLAAVGDASIVVLSQLCSGNCQYGYDSSAVSKLARRAGIVVWTNHLPQYVVRQVVVDRQGNIVLSGSSPGSEASPDRTTSFATPVVIKLSGETGDSTSGP